jgi:hypothetical protein
LWGYYSGGKYRGDCASGENDAQKRGRVDQQGLGYGCGGRLEDTYHRPKAPAISPEAKAWVVHLACSKPKELGHAAEVWSRRSLAKHVRERAAEAGHPSLSQAAKATVRRILAEQPLHPRK